MAKEKRIPRVRIHEDNFSEEIKNLSYPEACFDNFDRLLQGYFLEVVNAKDEIIALLYHHKPFNKIDFLDVLDYAKYYDTLVVYQMIYEDWDNNKEKFQLSDDKTIEDARKMENICSWSEVPDHPPDLDDEIGISSYYRLKYPFGLDEENRKNYEIYRDLFWRNRNRRISHLRYFSDDAVDILNFLLISIRTTETIENFNELILNLSIQDFIDSGFQVINGIAGNLLTKDNIYFFIDEARHKKTKQEFEDYYDSILNLLHDYKNKHFPSAKRSPKQQIFGIQRIKLLESDLPPKMPKGKEDYFLDVINSEGKTKALFFIANSHDYFYDSLFESEEWNSFVNLYDYWLTPNHLWGGIEFLHWLPKRLGEKRMQELLNDMEISEVNKLIYDDIPDDWRYYIDGDDYEKSGPETSYLPALFLMAFGRLIYPYKLTNEIRENCELYIRGFVIIRNLIGEFTNLTDDPKEIAELFNFCMDPFPDKESFREVYINQNSIKELVLCDPEIFMIMADSILCKENIDHFLDEAHEENKTDLKLFLLDYKNKQFPVDGQQLEHLSE